MNKHLKEKLGNKELTIGTWLSFGYSQTTEMMAKSGFDWIVVDMEHSSTDFTQMRRLIQIIELCGTTPLVRVGENDPLLIKKAMDAGAAGIIVPMVSTVEDAKAAINSLYYAPVGSRGVGLSRAQEYGADFQGYRKKSLVNSILIAQIEHKDAVDNLEAILALDHVDGFIVGPYDMSASLGIPGEFDHPFMQEMMKKIHAVAKNSPKPGGFHVVECNPDDLEQRIREGYTLFAYSTEMIMLMEKIRDELISIKQLRK